MSTELIAAISTGIIGPLIAYLKVRDERVKTGEKRDTESALLNKRVIDLETKVDTIEDLKKSIDRINITLAKIETILEMYMKKFDKE